jgi:hypothetical protein
MSEDLNVIELGAGSVAGALPGMLLADAAAHIIKLELPDSDRLRPENPSGFLVWNRGKSSVAADLRLQANNNTPRTLVPKPDVVDHPFAPAITDACGLVAWNFVTDPNGRISRWPFAKYQHEATAGGTLAWLGFSNVDLTIRTSKASSRTPRRPGTSRSGNAGHVRDPIAMASFLKISPQVGRPQVSVSGGT